jgi:hypothetical protein
MRIAASVRIVVGTSTMRGGECSRSSHSLPIMIGAVGYPGGQTSAGRPRFTRTVAMFEASVPMIATRSIMGPVVK